MKEQIRSNLGMQQFSNVERLTTRPFPPTLGVEGDIFMAEPGQGEKIPVGNAPKPPELPRSESGAIKPISPERTAQTNNEWDNWINKKAGRLPHPIAGGQEAGVPLFPDADTFDPRLQRIAQLVDSRRLAGQADIDFIDEQLRMIGPIMLQPGITLELSTQASDMIGRLYAERDRLESERMAQLSDQQREQLELQREERRYGIFGERRLERQEKLDIKQAVLGPTEQEMRDIETNLARPSPDMTEQQIQEARARISEQRDRLRGIDRIFNRMFENVDTNPKLAFGESFSAGNYEYLEFVRTINEAISEVTDPTVKQQILRHLRGYVEERKLREAAHNVNYVVVSDRELEDLIGFVRGFQAEQADLAFSKTGVSTVLHFYEQALLKVREENDGYLPTYAVVGEAREGSTGRVEELTRTYIREAIRVGTLPQMEDWEINRAISLARGMGIINGSFIEIAATSKLPGEPERGASFLPRIVNPYAGKIITALSPFKHLAYKYNLYDERNRVFAFYLNRGKEPWTKEELEEFKVETMLDVINGLVADKDARFLSVLNPFRLGGLFSRTAWRIHGDPVVGATGDFMRENPENRNWIGTGIWIERLRGDLNRLDPNNPDNWARDEDENYIMENGRHVTKGVVAERTIREQLNKIARTSPLKLFYNLKGRKLKGDREDPISEDLQKAVLRRLGKRITGDNLIDEELRGDLDTLVVLQEKALRDALGSDTKQEVALDLSDEAVGDPARAQRLRRFAEAVRIEFTEPQDRLKKRSHLDKFVEDLKDREWKIPFIFGTDDVPYEEYKFAKTGSDSFQRRWNDIGQGKKATETMLKIVHSMPNFRSSEQIVPMLDELHGHIFQYDEGIAREVVLKFAEGIAKFYKKDWYARLPLFMGSTVNLAQTVVGRGSSFAELAFGKGQMSWDETDISGFTTQLHESGLITRAQMDTLREEKVGGTKRELVMGYARLLIPIISLAFTYYILSKSIRVKG